MSHFYFENVQAIQEMGVTCVESTLQNHQKHLWDDLPNQLCLYNRHCLTDAHLTNQEQILSICLAENLPRGVDAVLNVYNLMYFYFPCNYFS